MLVLGLGLQECGLGYLYLRLGVGDLTGGAALGLMLRVLRLLQLVVLAEGGGFGGVAGGGEIVALNGSDVFASSDGVAFVDGELLDAAGDAGADDDFVGIDGADELEIGGAIGREAVSYTHLRAHETGRNLVCRLL